MAAGLEAAGFELVRCDDAPAHGQPMPDIALIDLTLSPHPQVHLEGVALAERLARAQIPFVFVTEHRDDALLKLAVQTGAIGYFVKPIDLSVLGPSIHTWLAWAAEARRCREERNALVDSVSESRSIGTAVGILSERHRLTPQEAFDALRRQARSERRALADLAAGVVEGASGLPDSDRQG
jgi:response regulator NasT